MSLNSLIPQVSGRPPEDLQIGRAKPLTAKDADEPARGFAQAFATEGQGVQENALAPNMANDEADDRVDNDVVVPPSSASPIADEARAADRRPTAQTETPSLDTGVQVLRASEFSKGTESFTEIQNTFGGEALPSRGQPIQTRITPVVGLESGRTVGQLPALPRLTDGPTDETTTKTMPARLDEAAVTVSTKTVQNAVLESGAKQTDLAVRALNVQGTTLGGMGFDSEVKQSGPTATPAVLTPNANNYAVTEVSREPSLAGSALAFDPKRQVEKPSSEIGISTSTPSTADQDGSGRAPPSSVDVTKLKVVPPSDNNGQTTSKTDVWVRTQTEPVEQGRSVSQTNSAALTDQGSGPNLQPLVAENVRVATQRTSFTADPVSVAPTLASDNRPTLFSSSDLARSASSVDGATPATVGSPEKGALSVAQQASDLTIRAERGADTQVKLTATSTAQTVAPYSVSSGQNGGAVPPNGLQTQITKEIRGMSNVPDGTELDIRPEAGNSRIDATGRDPVITQVHTTTSRGEQIRPPLVTAQIAEAARTLREGQMEVTLVPEELGRVRLTMTPSEAGMAVTIMAERPETLELMRRNIELLARDLSNQGFENLSFNFGGSGSGASQSTPDEQGLDVGRMRPEPTDLEALTAPPPAPPQNGLDLRL